MARFFDRDRKLLPEFVPYRKDGLLAVDPKTLIPTWYPDGDGSPAQRVEEFEATLRAWIVAGPRDVTGAGAADHPEMRLLAALRTLRSTVRT
jgi:hypothetical protein